ncbi:hypothetical protein LOTGIDRAFT_170353 [Lottia gigantea]|uniref:Polysaccharide pyruvyl transferase domain-containing protein n=1 Tax=Lottia gigantea TaxID=225164 RepID=V4B1H6_LOTGI|nr:hypothetical protein LOTGIDRAFT_170353 [Lottia gigantea]ESO82079.1 hypothetical protein LOTGIDRAFT_170353 [Lottia gigantea]
MAFMLKSSEPVISEALDSLRKKSCRSSTICLLIIMMLSVYIFGGTFSSLGFAAIISSNVGGFMHQRLIKTSAISTNMRLQQILKSIFCIIMLMVLVLILQHIGLFEQKACVILFVSTVNVAATLVMYFSKLNIRQDTDTRTGVIELSILVIIMLLLIEGSSFDVWKWSGLSLYLIANRIQTQRLATAESLPDQQQYEQTGFQMMKYIILLSLILLSTRATQIVPSPSFEHSQVSLNRRSAYSQHLDIQNLKINPLLDDLVKQLGFSYQSVLSNPQEETRVQALTDTRSVINEIQRIHFNLFTELLRPYKFVILLDISHTESKGDPAITVGEVLLIQRLGKKLIHYCSEACCTDPSLTVASKISQLYSKDELVIMIQGGGNLIGWETHDLLRARAFKHFEGFNFIMFPQTLFIKSTPEHLEFCHQLYRNQENLTMLFRDQISFELGKKHFIGKAQLILAPDMAFQIGPKKRIMDPTYDIVWLKRVDKESPGYEIPVDEIPHDILYTSDDWVVWSTHIDNYNALSNAFMFVNSGFTFLQRGRVVITDRLHGHILSVLMDIPHVLIGNQYKKIDGFYQSWTYGLHNVRMATNASHALSLALELLKIYNDDLPPKLPFMEIKQPCIIE